MLDDGRLVAQPIATKRLRLQPLRLSDTDEMFAVLNDQRLHEFTGGAPRSLAELRSKFESLAAGQSPDGREAWLNWVVRRIDGPAIGYVQAGVADGSAAVA